MATVALFHSVLGVRQGVLDAAERLRADGHDVVMPDLFAGRTFDDYPPALEFALREVGETELMRRALSAVADVADGFVAAGFSLGCVMAVHAATQRPVSGVLMFAGAIPPSAMGAVWPAGVPAQTHAMVDDPWRDDHEVADTLREVQEAGGHLDVFDYPGAGHLFTDPTLPAEFDAAATDVMWSRVLPFLSSLG